MKVTAQDLGSCLPAADHRASATVVGDVQLKQKGNAAQSAHAPATAGPAGVPGGLIPRGAASTR